MCGISGIIGRCDNDLKLSFQALSKEWHKKRGPDHYSNFEKEDLLLTHSRLKIIDLSSHANQPMLSASGKSCIVFNGEIFNFKAIAAKLNLNLNATSDTQVLVEAFEHNGFEQTLELMHGMFAICWTDFENNKSYIVRDRFGQKPLYYLASKQFAFSSDIRVLAKTFRNELNLDMGTIRYFLSELDIPQPATIWKEIKQLKPAHYLVVNEKGKVEEEVQYWKLAQSEIEISEEEALYKVEKSLNEAIEKRTVSDVPVGCFLSGGVDSGLITSLMSQQFKSPIKTFSIGFDFSEHNELEDAKIIAKKYNTDHHEFMVKVAVSDKIEDILSSFGEPFADSSAIPSYLLCNEVKGHIGVVLSGDGGDELFGGYLAYDYAYRAENFLNQNPNKLVRQTKIQGSKILSRLSSKITNLGTEEEYAYKGSEQLSRHMGFKPEAHLIKGVHPDFILNYWEEIWQSELNDSITTTLMRSSLKTRLRNDYLVKVDATSMANSLEVRSPFLDHELAELAFSIPNELKFKNGQAKFLLKKLGQKHMYSDIFDRRKRGFTMPLAAWLKNELFSFAEQHVKDLVKRTWIGDESWVELVHEHKTGKIDHSGKIWAMICLEIWLKKNFD